MTGRYARVHVEVEPPHLDRLFDYAIPADLDHPVQVGSRVEVVFAGRRRRALVADIATTTDVPEDRIRPLRRVFGPHVWMTAEEQEVARWAAERYAAPVADVIRHALPARVVDVERRAESSGWFPPGRADRPAAVPAPDPDALAAGWAAYGAGGRELFAAAGEGSGAFFWRPLPGEDLGRRLSELVRATLAGGRDVLLVVPDPASPAATAVVDAAGDLVVDARGGLSPRRTYSAWLRARAGQARVVVGERGAAWWPVARLGLAVVLDEANPALKEQRSPRHHAREVLLERARRAGGVGLVAGYVPSAPAWRLLTERRLTPVTPEREQERSAAPLVTVDTQEGRVRTRIGPHGVAALRRAVADGTYGVVLAARRGEGRALVCSGCGLRLACPRCDSSLAPVAGRPAVHCAGCGWQGPRRPCEQCGGSRFAPLAAGAERVAEELRRTVDVEVAVLEGYAAEAPSPPAVLVMTRGSVLDTPPGPVGAVVLPDLDGQLRRPVLDAAEDALRLSMQVAAWTVHGDADGAGRDRRTDAAVVVQTRDRDHHVVRALLAWDPGAFWRRETEVRAPLRFPPVAYAIRLELGAGQVPRAAVAAVLPDGDELLGPLPLGAREAYLIKSTDRRTTVAALDAPRREWSRGGVEVRVDVDPVDVQ